VISCFSVHDPDGADADLSEADVEDEVAKAEARAEAARARLEKLRGSAEAEDPEHGADGDSAAQDVEQRPAKPTRARLRLPRRPERPQWLRRPGRPQWLRRPGRKAIAAGVGAVLFSASLGASGYMLWQHHTAAHNRQLAVEFTAAARQGVTALMSIDPDHARRDVQAMLDATTGNLNGELSVMSALMVKKAEDSKVGSKVSVEGVAVESLSDNSGVVLVAAKTETTGPDNAKPPPALFRLSVTINRDGGKLKMSKVDYLE
jgi:Mce-associated membrane protein